MKLTSRRSLRTIQANDSTAAIALPPITDAASIQRAIAAVLHAAAEGTLEAPRARVLLYGLQIAATNARRIAAEKPVKAEAASTPVAEDTAPVEAAQETAHADVAEEAAPPAAIEAVAEHKVQEEPQAHARNAIANNASEALQPSLQEAEQPEEMAQPASPTPAQTEEAAAPVTGYTGNARNRLLAFRQRQATW